MEITKDDINWIDDGEYWRAEGPHNIDPSAIQEIEYITAGGQKTGIRYATGPDQTGEVRMAYVKYPKSIWSLEELQSSDGVPNFFVACNVCNYANHMRKMASSKYPTQEFTQPPERQVQLAQYPSQQPQYYQPQTQPPQRVSLGDVLPKYVPLALDVLRQIWLTKMGDLAFSTVLSVGADIAGGMSGDPGFKHTMRCASDALVDGVVQRCDEQYIDGVKDGIGQFVDAYRADGDFLDAFIKSSLRPTDEVLSKAGISSSSSRRSSSRPSASQRRVHSFNTID